MVKRDSQPQLHPLPHLLVGWTCFIWHQRVSPPTALIRRIPRTSSIFCSSRLGGPTCHPPVSTRRMSMSRMKVALTNSQTQRPCVSRKWRTEGLGRSEFRSQVHSSAAGDNGSRSVGPSWQDQK